MQARPFLRRRLVVIVLVLLLLGAAALRWPRQVRAISGAVSALAYQPAVSPRELGVSIPANPVNAVVEEPRIALPPERPAAGPAGSRAERADAEDTEARRERRRQRRRERRERRSRPVETEPAAPVSGAARLPGADKEVKQTVLPPAAAARPQLTLSGGWQSRYIYHGLDIISFNSRERANRFGLLLNGNSPRLVPLAGRFESSSIWFADATLAWRGLRFGLTYVQAVDPTVPFFSRNTIPFSNRVLNAFAPPGPRNGRFFSFPGDRVSIYREVDLHLDYTLSVVPTWLDLTAGANGYFFPNRGFKGTNYQVELPVRLTFTHLPYVRPSFTFYRYISDYKETNQAGNLNGNFAEFRIDSAFPAFKSPRLNVGLAPYVAATYNINYLKYGPDGQVGGWNTFEAGLKVPVTIAKSFAVTPFGSYGADVSDNGRVNNFSGRGFGERTRWWGGVNVAYTF